jgi:hypothetical protein
MVYDRKKNKSKIYIDKIYVSILYRVNPRRENSLWTKMCLAKYVYKDISALRADKVKS